MALSSRNTVYCFLERDTMLPEIGLSFRSAGSRPNYLLAGCAKDGHFLFQSSAQKIPLLLQVEPRLKVEPKPL
jgi:hypothetical protein